MCAQVKHIADRSTQAFGVSFSCLSQALKPLHLFPTEVMPFLKLLKLYLITCIIMVAIYTNIRIMLIILGLSKGHIFIVKYDIHNYIVSLT